MILVIPQELEQPVIDAIENSQSESPIPLRALFREDEELLTLDAIGDSEIRPKTETSLAGWLVKADPSINVARLLQDNAIPEQHTRGYVLIVDRDSGQRTCYYGSAPWTNLEPCQLETIQLETDLFSRTKGILDTGILLPKTVAFIGLGSGGSLGAVELAKCGVGNFILVDFDRLWAHNISRHTCGIADIGRFKTRAVRDMILDRNPMANVKCYEVDICEAPDLLEKIVTESDLVFVATDTEIPKYIVNEICLEANKPAIYGGAYERAFAGEVIRVIPGKSACYACVRQNMADTIQAIERNEPFDYTDEDTTFRPEPGLGVDVGMIVLLQVKMALLTLLRNTESTLEDIQSDMIIWTNSARPQDGKLFEKPMKRYFIDVQPIEDCPVCHSEEYFQGKS